MNEQVEGNKVVEVGSFLPGKKKILIALVTGAVSAAMITWLIERGVEPDAAVKVVGIVISSLLAYLGLEGVRDIVKAARAR